MLIEQMNLILEIALNYRLLATGGQGNQSQSAAQGRMCVSEWVNEWFSDGDMQNIDAQPFSLISGGWATNISFTLCHFLRYRRVGISHQIIDSIGHFWPKLQIP